jgi:hypothetical protein
VKTLTSLLALVTASITALAPGQARADTTWTFANVAARSTAATAAAHGPVDAMVFNVTAAAVAPTSITRMVFVVDGTVNNAELANFQLVYYPNGPASPGVVVGSNTGAAFAPGGTTGALRIDLANPIALQGNYSGLFALRSDVNGVRSFFFAPRLQTVTVNQGGADRFLMETEDLPMSGSMFYVN